MSGIFITAYKNRTTYESVSFRDAAGELVVLAADDKVRIKIGRQGAAPTLEIVSGTPLAGGTSVSAANPATLRIDQDDVSTLTPGIYDIEAAIIDDSDEGRILHAEMGVFSLIGTQGGEVT